MAVTPAIIKQSPGPFTQSTGFCVIWDWIAEVRVMFCSLSEGAQLLFVLPRSRRSPLTWFAAGLAAGPGLTGLQVPKGSTQSHGAGHSRFRTPGGRCTPEAGLEELLSKGLESSLSPPCISWRSWRWFEEGQRGLGSISGQCPRQHLGF